MSEVKRRFSLDEDFMNYKSNDILYGFMRSISTSMPTPGEKEQRKEYLLVSTYKKHRKELKSILNMTDKGISKNLDKLIELGLVQEGTMKSGNNEYACYYFPYEYDGTFKYISVDLLWYLVNTASSNVIRVYLYLLNKSTLKEDYVFTLKEIKAALGYAESTKTAEGMIRSCLACLKTQGIIDFIKDWQEQYNPVGVMNKTERMVLKFVATDVSISNDCRLQIKH